MILLIDLTSIYTSKVAPWRELAGIPCSGAPTVRAIKSISPQPILIVSTAVEMAELQGCKATAVCVASEHARMIRLCRANSEGILYSPAIQMVGSLYKRKKATYFRRSLSWYHQGLMYPCKHLYLNALPLAYIKKPRDRHV